MNTKHLTVNALECPDCGDFIYSRTRHDYHYCSCGSVFIDGGFDYIRLGGRGLEKTHKLWEINLGDKTKQDLASDWNYKNDRLGTIKNCDIHKYEVKLISEKTPTETPSKETQVVRSLENAISEFQKAVKEYAAALDNPLLKELKNRVENAVKYLEEHDEKDRTKKSKGKA